jgi:hypothetical protein
MSGIVNAVEARAPITPWISQGEQEYNTNTANNYILSLMQQHKNTFIILDDNAQFKPKLYANFQKCQQIILPEYTSWPKFKKLTIYKLLK